MPSIATEAEAAVAAPVKEIAPPTPPAGAEIAVAAGAVKYKATAVDIAPPATTQAVALTALILIILFFKAPLT